jgi:hypothetical protein
LEARLPSAGDAFERLPVPPKTHVAPVSRLVPPELGLPSPAQFPPEGLLARMTFRAVQSSFENTPPPRLAALSAKVTFFKVNDSRP